MSLSKGAPFKGIKPSEKEGRHDPKFIGEIPGYPVGSRFINRIDLSAAGVHAPLRGGIHGNQVDGAYSVVLSYGYEDDEDSGETFIYTGQGGRDTDSSKLDKMRGKESWSSHQASDQEWKLGNKALRISCGTGKPVRVIRGAPRKNPELFKYAPSEGLRYDGLYRVTHAWKDEGATGFQTCKFRFERLPNQLPLPGGHASSSSAASSSKKPFEFFRSNYTKSLVASSSKLVKPPRKPHIPRPPYRPSAADIAKLKSHSKSKSTSHSITPEYTSATSRPSHPQQGTSQSQTKGMNPRPPYRPSETGIAKLKGQLISHSTSPDCAGPARPNKINTSIKAESASPEPGPVFSPCPSSSSEPENFNRKRTRNVSEGSEESEWWRRNITHESDEESLVDSGPDDDRRWVTVRGKQKLPSSLNFKKSKVE